MPNEPENDKRLPEYTIAQEKVFTGLDPELQGAVVQRRASTRAALVSANVPDVIEVIAKLVDPKTKIDGLHVVGDLGQIVTGTVDADKIEEVRQDPNVISLKAARGLRPMLLRSIVNIEASHYQLETAFPDQAPIFDGTGVIVGIIDHGCDFAHSNFRNPKTGATRILFLWDQREGFAGTEQVGQGRAPEPFGYGCEFNSDAINNALCVAAPTAEDPSAPHGFLNYKLSGSHGTAVMDIAAGNGAGTSAPGVAPGADIIFVDESSQDSFFTGDPPGNSRRLLDAVAYVFQKAEMLGRPAVVNISLGYEVGPHDGSTLVEQGFDSLLERPGRAIVIAAGNSRVHLNHIRRTLHPRRTHILRWQTFEDLVNRNKMDLWYSGNRVLAPILRSPRGYELGPFPLDSTYTIYRNGKPAGFVYHRANDPTNNNNNLVLTFTPLMETGIWELDLRLLDDGSRSPIDIHAWIETDKQPSIFPDTQRTDTTGTLNALGCGRSTILVGAYNHLNSDSKLAASAEGPTPDGKFKPDVSAPGSNILTAQPLSNSTTIADGTSAAAPHVTGVIALLMQSAATPLFVDEIREFVINTARQSPPPADHGWDTCYGVGRVSAVATLRAQLKLPAIPTAVTDVAVLAESLTFSDGDIVALVGGKPLESVSAEFDVMGEVDTPILASSSGKTIK